MSSLLSVKLRRDLQASWSRFVLMTIAIALTLTAFGGILLAWSASGRETANAYLSTEPASATILLDEALDAGTMAAIADEVRERPGIIEAAGRTQFNSAVERDGSELDIPLQVFVAAPDDPMRMATFFIQQGSWPPPAGEIFIERSSFDLLGIAIGDTMTVTTPDGQPVQLRVTDTVYDPSLSPSPQEQTARGYLSTASMTGSGEQAPLDQLKIQVADEQDPTTPSLDRDAVVATATNVGAWLQAEHGLTIREIQVPKPDAHPHQWQADALLLSLLAGGAAALLLSTMLVANMLNNLFTQQIPQIGIMKAIGARSGHIGRLYLAMTLLVALAATVLAMVPAVLLGRLAVANFLGFLGIEPGSLGAPWWAYLVVAAVGLSLPLLMTLLPLMKAARITVRAAIDHHGGGSKPAATTGLLARLGRSRRLDRGLLLALRNTFRRPARFWLSVALLASAGTVFVSGMSLSTGTDAIADEQKAQRNWDVDLQLVSPAAVDQVTAILEELPGVSRVDAFNVTQTGVAVTGQIPVTRTYPDQGHGRVSMTAVPADTTTFATPTMLEGRWLNPGETGAIVLNQITVASTVPGTTAGDTVQLIVGGKSTTWSVVGITEERSGSGGVYATAEGFAAATDQTLRANQLRIITDDHDEQSRTATAAAVDQTLTDGGFEVNSAASVSRGETISSGHLGPIVLILLAVALPLGVVGVIGLASTMSANVLDRTREFGIMHAIGALPRAVRRIVKAEGIFLALTSCLVAAIPTLALTAVLGTGLGNLFFYAPLPYRISWFAVGAWVVVVVLGSILATDAAETRASRVTVREALAYV